MVSESGDGMCGIQRSGGEGDPFCVAGHTPPVGVAVWRNVLSDITFKENLTTGKYLGIMSLLQQFAAACSNFLIR